MSISAQSEILVPLPSVAKAAELEPWALQKLEQARFRVPENFREVDDKEFLTIAGVLQTARTLEAHGYTVRAHSVRVLAKQWQETPSAVNPPKKLLWYQSE